jgi:protein SCO1/2
MSAHEAVLRAATGSLLTLTLAGSGPLAAQQAHDHQQHEDHSAHQQQLQQGGDYRLSRVRYEVPDVRLVDQAGAGVALRELLAAPEPLALNFVFTTCTTICPVMTATFAQLQRTLGPRADTVRLVSISIDPDYDTPEVLATYAKRWNASQRWRFLTGSAGDVVAVQKAFEAYAGAKTNHRPATFLRGAGDTEWLRVDGLATGTDLSREWTALLER